MRTRTGRLLAGAVIVAALVSGCSSGPSKVDAAAVIGDDTVSLSEVQPQIAALLSRPDLMGRLRTEGVGPQDVGRAVVSQLIMHELLERGAAERRITVRDDEVTAAAAEEGVDFSSPDTVPGARDRVRDELLASKLAAAQLDRLSYSYEAVTVSGQAQAETVGRSLAAAPPSSPPPGTRRPSVSPSDLTPLIGVPAGEVVLLPRSQGRWSVARIVARNPNDAPVGPATARVPRQDLATAGMWLLIPEAQRLGITVNPRYGVWDPVSLTVVQDASQSGQLIRAAPAAR